MDVDIYRASEGGYLRLDLQNVAGNGVITSVEMQKEGATDGRWKSLTNTYGAKWEVSMLPEPPLDLRITGADGEVLVAR